MEGSSQQPLLDDELQPTSAGVAPEDLRIDQSPESLRQDEEHKVLSSKSDQDHVRDAKEQNDLRPDPSQDRPEVQAVDQGPGEDSESGVQDQVVHEAADRALLQDQNRTGLDSNPDLTTATANQDEAGESGGSVPSLVVSETAEGSRRAASAAPVSPAQEAALQKPERLPDPENPAAAISSSDGADMACSDLLSLRSDSLSLTSESNVFRRNEDDDTRSVTTSSVMSLFHRVPLEPLEKEWLKSSAVGNMATQRRLFAQEPGLVLKKTALHWAAKQGCQEAVDMMLLSGADVNVRSGYTALHLASIHGHQDIVQSLINTYNAKTSIRDYHGKMAVHYWSGSTDIFSQPDAQSGGRSVRCRRTQRYALPALLLSRSRSQGQLNLEFGTLSQSSSHDALDLHV